MMRQVRARKPLPQVAGGSGLACSKVLLSLEDLRSSASMSSLDFEMALRGSVRREKLPGLSANVEVKSKFG